MVTTAPDAKHHRSILVSDGFTYTSPSLYFAIMGTASFSDDCGQLGTKVVSSTLAIPPGVMSTVSFDVPVGAPLPQGWGAAPLRHIAALKTRDLACPTWGVNMAVPPKKHITDANEPWPTIGPPFFPLLVPPRQLLSVDIAWSKCVDNHWPLRFGIFDPPRALTANSAMVVSPMSVPTPQPDSDSTLVDPTIAPQPQAAQAPAPDVPQQTATIESNVSGSGNSGSSNDDPGDSSTDNPGSAADPGSDNTEADNPSSKEYPAILSDGLKGFGGTAYPVAAHAITVGAATYMEAAECSCYTMAPGRVLNRGSSITMPDGDVVALASNGAHAVVGGSTQQIAPIVTGVAPAFAGVMNPNEAESDNGPEATAGERTVNQVPETKATFSAHGYALTAAPASGGGGLFVLKGSGGVFATLNPGGKAFTIMGNEVVSLGANGVLKLDESAVATLAEKSTSTSGKNGVGAAVATAFSMGPSDTVPTAAFEDTAEVTPAASTSTKEASGAVSSINSHMRILWLEIWLLLWASTAVLLL